MCVILVEDEILFYNLLDIVVFTLYYLGARFVLIGYIFVKLHKCFTTFLAVENIETQCIAFVDIGYVNGFGVVFNGVEQFLFLAIFEIELFFTEYVSCLDAFIVVL